MTYCGCATPSSKARWAVMAFLLVLGAALFIGSFVEVSKCKVCTATGVCSRRGFSYNTSTDVVEDSEGTVLPGASTHIPMPPQRNTIAMVDSMCAVYVLCPSDDEVSAWHFCVSAEACHQHTGDTDVRYYRAFCLFCGLQVCYTSCQKITFE